MVSVVCSACRVQILTSHPGCRQRGRTSHWRCARGLWRMALVVLPEPPALWPLRRSNHGFPECAHPEGKPPREDHTDGLDVSIMLFYGQSPRGVFGSSCNRGIIVMVGSTISILLALTWGGLQFRWTSGHVLAPLIIGAAGILTFFVLELLWLKGPTVSHEPTSTSVMT